MTLKLHGDVLVTQILPPLNIIIIIQENNQRIISNPEG